MKPTFPLTFCCALMVSAAFQAGAFSLRGPDGNAVNTGEEYRWNVPIVTYDFDQSFLDYFGAKGVKAVDEAFQILNGLPRASRLDPAQFPLDTRRFNFPAATQGLLDLKSVALARVIEQLGLARPTEHIFDWNGSIGALMYGADLQLFAVYHNFDPQTLQPTQVVNGVLYQMGGFFGEVPVDPLAMSYNAVADQAFQSGLIYTGLTRDDAGGLRYLLSRTNINREPLPFAHNPRQPMVWRGGVEKITFVRHSPSSAMIRWLSGKTSKGRGAFEPDFIFSAPDPYAGNPLPIFSPHSGSSNWINNAAANGNPGGAGPGIIHGPVRIELPKRGQMVWTINDVTSVVLQGWGSCQPGTNPPTSYPYQTNKIHEVLIRLWRVSATSIPMHVPVPFGGTVALQTSTNGTDWTTACVVANLGNTIEWNYFNGTATFFRAIPDDGATTTPGSSYDVFPRLVITPVTIPLPPGLTPEEQAILIEAQRMRNLSNLPPTPILPPLILTNPYPVPPATPVLIRIEIPANPIGYTPPPPSGSGGSSGVVMQWRPSGSGSSTWDFQWDANLIPVGIATPFTNRLINVPVIEPPQE